jgi:hypothetical protein
MHFDSTLIMVIVSASVVELRALHLVNVHWCECTLMIHSCRAEGCPREALTRDALPKEALRVANSRIILFELNGAHQAGILHYV